MIDASDYWSSASDGNGSGILNQSGGATDIDSGTYHGELPQFFYQLHLAELVAESYDGSSTLGVGYPDMIIEKEHGMIAGNV